MFDNVKGDYIVDITTKEFSDEGDWIVEGLATTSDLDRDDDIITDEAIRAAAKDLLESSTVLKNHDPDEEIGRVLESEAGKQGMRIKVLISKTVPNIWQKIKEGVLNKFSVRFKILEVGKKWIAELKKNVRLIKKMELIEVSIVSVPANPKAQTIGWHVAKALNDAHEKQINEEKTIMEKELRTILGLDKDGDILETVKGIVEKKEATATEIKTLTKRAKDSEAKLVELDGAKGDKEELVKKLSKMESDNAKLRKSAHEDGFKAIEKESNENFRLPAAYFKAESTRKLYDANPEAFKESVEANAKDSVAKSAVLGTTKTKGDDKKFTLKPAMVKQWEANGIEDPQKEWERGGYQNAKYFAVELADAE